MINILLMSILSILATIFGSAMALANLPQAHKIFKRKSAKDISRLAYSVLLFGAVIWILYGVEIKSFPIIISNVLGTTGIGLVLLGCFLYSREVSPPIS